MTTQMTILDRFSASASVCDDFVTLGRKNDLQGTWREEEEEEEKQLGPWVHLLTSLFLCFTGSPVIVFVGFLKKIKSSSLHYFYIASYLGSALTWIVEGMGGGGFIMSQESDGMHWSSFGHLSHSTSRCFVWQTENTLFFRRCRKLSVNNCWHFLCLDSVRAMLLKM